MEQSPYNATAELSSWAPLFRAEPGSDVVCPSAGSVVWTITIGDLGGLLLHFVLSNRRFARRLTFGVFGREDNRCWRINWFVLVVLEIVANAVAAHLVTHEPGYQSSWYPFPVFLLFIARPHSKYCVLPVFTFISKQCCMGMRKPGETRIHHGEVYESAQGEETLELGARESAMDGGVEVGKDLGVDDDPPPEYPGTADEQATSSTPSHSEAREALHDIGSPPPASASSYINAAFNTTNALAFLIYLAFPVYLAGMWHGMSRPYASGDLEPAPPPEAAYSSGPKYHWLHPARNLYMGFYICAISLMIHMPMAFVAACVGFTRPAEADDNSKDKLDGKRVWASLSAFIVFFEWCGAWGLWTELVDYAGSEGLFCMPRMRDVRIVFLITEALQAVVSSGF